MQNGDLLSAEHMQRQADAALYLAKKPAATAWWSTLQRSIKASNKSTLSLLRSNGFEPVQCQSSRLHS